MGTIAPGPGSQSAIAQEWGADLLAYYTQQNNNIKSGYQNVFSNWMIEQIGAPPAPPQLFMFNETLAIQLYMNWSNSLASMTPGGPPPPTFDISPAITYVTLAPLRVPPPAITPPPTDPVGPPTGNFDAFGWATYENVMGETPAQYPNGATFDRVSTGQVFVHEESATPFGISSQWALMPQPH